MSPSGAAPGSVPAVRSSLLRGPLALACAPLLTAGALALPAAAPAATKAQTQASLRAIVRAMPSGTSVYVRESATQTVLASRAPTARRIPASVTKLFTTSSALLLDGPQTTLDTELRIRGEIDDGGVLRGDLIVRAAGNPALRLDQVSALAKVATDAGITRIDGQLHADLAGWTGDQGTPLTGGAYNREIGGRIGALVTLRGFGSATVTDPARQVLVRLRDAMRSRGLKGPVTLGAPAPTGAGTTVLGTAKSPTMTQLVAATNAPSDNFYAEMLLRGLGARHGSAGTTTAGLAAQRAVLLPLGVRATLADGSGLSRGNRVAPTTVVRLLDAMAARPEGAALRSGLALAGNTGTLAGRMRGTAAAGRCRAKTGTLSNVSALAGWCTTLGKRTVAFAVLMNGVSVPSARRMQDRLAATIVNWTDRAVATDVPAVTSPVPTTPVPPLVGATTPAATSPVAAGGGVSG